MTSLRILFLLFAVYAAESSTYVRWGRTYCPGATTIYSGRAAGSPWFGKGGTSDYLCLTNVPSYDYTPDGSNNNYYSKLYGVEYDILGDLKGPSDTGISSPLKLVSQNNMPCAVCASYGRNEVLMIPGTDRCPTGWSEEYDGYLGTQPTHIQRGRTICIDEDAESLGVSRSHSEHNVSPIVLMKAYTSNLPSGYNSQQFLTCVVCTRA